MNLPANLYLLRLLSTAQTQTLSPNRSPHPEVLRVLSQRTRESLDDLLAPYLTTRDSIHRVSPKIVNKKIEVTAPIRIDLGTGLGSDLVLTSLQEGGEVLNLSSLINHEPCVKATIIPIQEPLVSLKSIDLGAQEVFTTLEALTDVSDLADPFRLAKATLIRTGVINPTGEDLSSQLQKFGAGMLIETHSRLPKGSGLGVSSILAGILLTGLWQLEAKDLDTHQLLSDVLWVERHLQIGGGWQDHLGGLVGGAKWIRNEAGTVKPIVEVLDLPNGVVDELEKRIILWGSGKRRDNAQEKTLLLREIEMIKMPPELVTIRHKAKEITRAIRTNLVEGNLTNVGQLLRGYLQLRFKRDPNEASPWLLSVLQQVDPFIEGANAVGAGGGGCYIFVAKKDGVEPLIQTLNRISDRGEVYRWTLDDQGYVQPLQLYPLHQASYKKHLLTFTEFMVKPGPQLVLLEHILTSIVILLTQS